MHLKPYQEEGLRFLLAARYERRGRRVRVLGDDPGLGKTATGSVCVGRLLASDPRGGMILAPASLVTVWRDELLKWGVKAPIILPKKATDLRAPQPGEVVIASFDRLASLHRKIKMPKPPKKPTPEADAAYGEARAKAQLREQARREALSKLYRRGFGFLLADEIQKTRRASSDRSLAFEKLRQHVSAEDGVTLVLSGTLMENTPMDLWVLAVCLGIDRELWPKGLTEFATHFGGTYDAFSRRWAFPPKPPGGSIYPHVVGSGLFLARKTEEVEGDLPPKSYKVTVCPCPDNLIEVSRVLSDALGGVDALTRADDLDDLELRAKGAGVLGELSRCRKETAAAKIPALLRRLDELGESVGPIVVYSEHVEPIETLRARPGWAVITGAETPKQRATIAAAFQAGEYKGIGITSAVREGWTLTRSHYMIKVSPSWLYQWEKQSDARVWRLSQTEPVTIEILVAEHAIDRAVYKRIAEGRIRDRETWARPE